LTVFPPSLTLPSDPNNTGGNTDKLLTAELRATLPALYSQEKTKDPVVHVIGLEDEWRSARVFTPDK
jgi:hypothetical protein